MSEDPMDAITLAAGTVIPGDTQTTTSSGEWRKPPTRIEKLGELYDTAIENVKKRIAPPLGPILVPEELQLIEAQHAIDIQVIQTYLQETNPNKNAKSYFWHESDLRTGEVTSSEDRK